MSEIDYEAWAAEVAQCRKMTPPANWTDEERAAQFVVMYTHPMVTAREIYDRAQEVITKGIPKDFFINRWGKGWSWQWTIEKELARAAKMLEPRKEWDGSDAIATRQEAYDQASKLATEISEFTGLTPNLLPAETGGVYVKLETGWLKLLLHCTGKIPGRDVGPISIQASAELLGDSKPLLDLIKQATERRELRG